MSETLDDDIDRATEATFKQDDIDRAYTLCGVESAWNQRDQFTEATHDSMRAFARSYGDDNRLYTDRDYGKTTRWGMQIAPPMMVRVVNNPLLGEKAPRRVAFRGIHQFLSGATLDFYRPMRPGDLLYKFGGMESLTPKESNFAGRSLIMTRRHTHMNQNGEVVAVSRGLMVMTERKAAREKKALAAIEPAHYTPEDIARHDAIYAAERPRGDTPRYWEDVSLGDEVGPLAKGPLTVTDIIFWHAGGSGFTFNPSVGRIAYKNRQRIGPFYVPNKQGVPDIAMRVHWDADWAKAIGTPMPYDYAVMREAWLAHVLTDWMGDGGWLQHIHDEIRKFNYLGDLHVIRGEVKNKRIEGDQHLVDIRVSGISQRGEETCHAVAVVSLPSRDHGPAGLPDVPKDLAYRAMKFMEDHCARKGRLAAI